MRNAGSHDSRPHAALLFAAATVLLHLAVNLFFHYGIFRDELYYVACSKRPDWGYVDHPPFGMWVLLAQRALFGDGIFALRLLPALLHGVTVFATGQLVRRMGGTSSALLIACVATALAPIQLAMHGVYSMNSIELACWPLAVLFFVATLERPSARRWMLLGVLLGVMLLNKISALWLGVGMAAALLLPEHRAQLRTVWPWTAAIVALLAFLPYALWNLAHDMAHLEFIRNASTHKYAGISRIDLLTQSVLLEGPLSVPLWVAASMFYAGSAGRRWRAAGVLFAVAALVLLANGHSKAEYLASAFPVVFAGGAVLIGRAASRLAILVRRAYAVTLAVIGLALAPLALPVLPPRIFMEYTAVIGVTHPNTEGKELHELPQFFADMHGWEDLARTVSAVYADLSREDRRSVVAITDNYGEAGALEYFSSRYPLPPAISPHNSWWWWGLDVPQAAVYLVLARDDVKLRAFCTDVREAAVFRSEYAMPFENGLKVYVCRGLRVPFAQVWKEAKFYI